MKTDVSTKDGKLVFPLDGPSGTSPVIELIDGPGCEPYLWFGNDDETFGATVSIGQLRQLRDSLTQALRRYGKA